MPSRRHLLATFGSLTAAGLAGCSGSDSSGSDTVDCHTNALAHGDGDLLDGGAMAAIEDDDVRLAVPLDVEAVRNQNVDELEVYDAAGELAHVVPVSTDDADVMANKRGVSDGQLRYEQHLGERPFHGQYRVVALDDSDETVDSVTVEFNCFTDLEE
jgi:hypothetical protein